MSSSEGPVSIAHNARNRIKRVEYDPSHTLREARDVYFAANGFPAGGGYEAKWVDFELGPIPMPFPNTDSRRRAVKLHDLHHLLTGYQTDIWGEFEISAWEVGAGCRDYYAAWALNLGGMAAGVLTKPKRIWHAFLRGRRSRSLYATGFSEALLDRRLGEVRAECSLDKRQVELEPANARDILAFLFYWQVGAWSSLASLPLAVLAGLAGVSMGLARRLAPAQ
jgi:hypothetical protein